MTPFVPPLPSVERSWIETTLGSTSAATFSIEPVGSETGLTWLVDVPLTLSAEVVVLSRCSTAAAPRPPPVTPESRAAATTSATVRRGLPTAGAAG